MRDANVEGMTAKYLTAALLVAALGCAQSAAPTQPVVAQSRAPLTKVTKVDKKELRVLRPVGVAQSMQPLANEPHIVINKTKEGGIGLHGPEKTYLEQVDPSGWSGRSIAAEQPAGIGGGPPANNTSDEDTSGNE